MRDRFRRFVAALLAVFMIFSSRQGMEAVSKMR